MYISIHIYRSASGTWSTYTKYRKEPWRGGEKSDNSIIPADRGESQRGRKKERKREEKREGDSVQFYDQPPAQV